MRAVGGEAVIRALVLGTAVLSAMVSIANGAGVQDGIDLLRAKKYAAANAVFADAAGTGSPIAMYHLGRSYIRGWGVAKDPAAALGWFQRAYDAPSDVRGKAAYEIGRIYQVYGTYRDYAKAYDWFWLSLEQGYGKGHVQLAVFYARGLGTKADKDQALFHVQRAAKLGYPQSMLAYARHLKAGDYGPADGREVQIWASRAIKILERQARRGSAAASVRLGRFYLAGDIVAKDEGRARKWLKWGRKLGSSLAKRYLAKIGE